MSLGAVIPVLRMFDEHKAKEFYLDYLGFDVVFEHRFESDLPLYMGIHRGSCVLHLTEHHADACPGSAIRVVSDDLDALHSELTAKKYGFYRPEMQVMPWGSKDMQVIDPFGNKITFSMNIST
ncbi:MAG: glyoxalase superfamily protein [bacterium]